MKIKPTPFFFLFRKRILTIIMRTFIFLLCSLSFGFTSVDIFSQNTNIEITNDISLTVDDVFKIIKRQTDYRFIYQEDMFKSFPKVFIKKGTIQANQLLEKSLNKGDFIFSIAPNNTIIIKTKEEPVDTGVQKRVIKGTVSDGQLPLPGASIVIKGTQTGTQTDFDGNYTIEVNTGDILIFSFVGMTTQEIQVGTSDIINVTMVADTSLDEVIVVAYGTAKKADFTGSATQLNSEALSKITVANISAAIEGSSAGVSVTAAGGQPGQGQSIRIRGFGSFDADSGPLYVVDGIPFYGSINSINPTDIESLTILKDASSTSLYGNKAANGVVMITTKRGRNKKGQFSLNASTSIVDRSIDEYERLGSNTYYEIMWESMRNSEAIPGVDSAADVTAANTFASTNIITELLNNPYNVPDDQIVGTDGKINPSARLLYNDLDWVDAVTRIGIRQNYDINYQGGTDTSDFYVSLGYLNEEGFIKKSNFERFSGRINANYQANNWLKTGLNLSATTSEGNQAQTGSTQNSSFVNPMRFARSVAPIYPIYKHNPDGSFILDDNGNRLYELDDNRPNTANGGRHILAEIDYNQDLDEITSLSGKTYFDINFTQDLMLTVNVSLDQRHWYTTDFENKIIGDGAPGGKSTRRYNRRTTLGFNQLLNYNKSFGNHNFKLLAAHESLQLKVNNFIGEKSQLIADGNTELINFVTTTNLSSVTDILRDESYFGRFNYDYDGKYFLSTSYRTDGSSKFAKDVRWGEFWSLGAAWRLERESFIENIAAIDLLKLRGSYGELGNNSGISWYAYQGLYDLDFNNQSESGFLQATLEAPLLEWESSESYDIALEFGLWNRLNGIIEYYNRESANLLFDVPLPLSSGSEDISKNIGTLFNRGIEISLDYDVIKSDHFNWNFGINATTIKNEFTKLPQEEIINGSKKLMVGHSIYDYWLKDWYGVDPADGAALYTANEDAIDANGSDIRVIDGNTLTTNQASAKFHYAGTAIPDLIGAISNSLRYKNFNLSFLMTYQIGGESIDYNYQSIMGSGNYGRAKSVDILKRWQKPGDITNVPRLDASQTTNFNATSDRWLVDASYLNMKRINFSYNLPSDFISSIGINTAQLYLSAENVFSINSRKGLNIQQNFSGTTSNVYTPSRIVSLGLNVKF
ncbi:SusC/RagA family TonB-linked outer membrane protein [Flavivirga spongiicola]|uniref:SusC/RagA family TonB-linked outer membrane protein n=1 Tax=Flavivirga spongiicola TaxID=421621 RepID=A0ABU7XT20_9FLAO|nr:SusC/RagA family TonB-linked outer membrane protein [Flavivirga sp. MEBiC05379]MDO5978588.1 SusC/RagA family TonB-linked outer membrane protein [Flavivirga sp. MEBiC05379]